MADSGRRAEAACDGRSEDQSSFRTALHECDGQASEQGSNATAWSCSEHVPVVVVGGGVAGLVAACSVLEAGGRVTLLERARQCGGSLAKAVGGISAAGTRIQSERGIADSAEAFVADVARGGPRRAELTQTLCESSGRDLDWLVGQFGLELPALERCRGHSVPRTHHAKDMDTGGQLVRALLQALTKASRESGRVLIVTRAHVTRLLADSGGACCGCVYLHGGVEHQELGPVVLCTGGFAASSAKGSLLAACRPDLVHLPVASSEYCTGDGLRMAEAVGARTIDLEWIHVHPVGLVAPDDPTSMAKLAAANALREAGGLILSQEGHRICDASASDEAIVCKMWRKRSRYRLVLHAAAAKSVMSLCETYRDLGLMKFFLNGEALAKDMGIPLSTLVSEFEAHCQVAREADGVLDEGSDAGPPAEGASPGKGCSRSTGPGALANEPFYVALVTPVLLCCLGGLETRPDGAVVGHGKRPIRGLYAAGEVASGVCGASYIGGNALLECLVFGRAAGRAAAECAFASSVGAPVERAAVARAANGVAAVANGGSAHGAAHVAVGGGEDVRGLRMHVTAARLEKFLESRLTAETLQAALATAHQHGGDLEAVQRALRSTLLGEADAEQGKAYLKMSLRDTSGLPAPVRAAPLPDFDKGFTAVPVSCVHCRSKLTLDVGRGTEGAYGDEGPSSEGAHAYATLLYGSKIEYFLGALVTGWSLKSTGTTKDLLLLHTADVPAPYLNVLARNWTLCEVQYLEGSPKLYKEYNRSRFKAVFTKLQALGCLNYDKVLMLDLDMLVRGSLDDLFSLRAPAALKRSSGREQPPHGGAFGARDMWRRDCDDMCSGINAGVMLLEPNQQAYCRMVREIEDPWHPEHIGTYGPEQDYLARFYCAFFDGQWTHIHAKFNYQLMLPDDYCSSAHKALDITQDVVVAHYSGPRVKPWKLGGDLDVAGATRLLHDDSVRATFGRGQWGAMREQRSGYRPQPRERVMDGVSVVEESGQSGLPEKVQSVMWEWVLALRKCAAGLKEEGVDILSILREVQSSAY